jgi:hypothetical protein
LEEQIAHARDQYRLRAERELKSIEAQLAHEEYGAKLFEIDEAADKQIPRFFRIGALVPIWGLFESFLSDFATWVRGREKAAIGLRDIRAQNFRVSVEKYFEGVLRIKLPWSPEEREELAKLQALRNFIAHRNGRVMDLSPEQEREITALVAKIPGVEIEDHTLVVSADYVAAAASLVFDLVGRLNQLLADRYGGPVVPGAASAL